MLRLGTPWERQLLSWHVFPRPKDSLAQSTQRERRETLWERQLLSWQVFSRPKDSFAQSTQRARREHRETPWERQLLSWHVLKKGFAQRKRTPAKLKFGVPRRSQMCSNLSFASSVFSVRTPFFPLRNPYRAKVRRSQGFPKNRVK